MSNALDRAVLEDELAMSLARALAAANDRARREGVVLKQSLVTAAEHTSAGEVCWRISYGPRDYVRRRGGDRSLTLALRTGEFGEFFGDNSPRAAPWPSSETKSQTGRFDESRDKGFRQRF